MTVCDKTREVKEKKHVAAVRSVVGKRSILQKVESKAGRTVWSDCLRRSILSSRQQQDSAMKLGDKPKHGGDVRIDQSLGSEEVLSNARRLRRGLGAPVFRASVQRKDLGCATCCDGEEHGGLFGVTEAWAVVVLTG